MVGCRLAQGGGRNAGAMLPRCCFSVLLFSGTRGKAQTPGLRSQEGELAARLCSAFPENRLVWMHPDSNHHIKVPGPAVSGKVLVPKLWSSERPRRRRQHPSAQNPFDFAGLVFVLRFRFVHSVVAPSMARSGILLRVVALSQPLLLFFQDHTTAGELAFTGFTE